jgi:hypothetical protein
MEFIVLKIVEKNVVVECNSSKIYIMKDTTLVVRRKPTEVSEESVASIFKVEM